MNKSDIEFTIGLNTSPAEQKLNDLGNKIKTSSHIYNDIFRDVGQGFKVVGTPYQNSNNYGVPSTQVLERTLSVTVNAMEKFARIVETMSMQMVNFTTIGRPYTSSPNVINMGNRVSGYLPPYYPSALFQSYNNSKPLGLPSPDYAINANDIFDAIIRKRKAQEQEARYASFHSMASEQFARTFNAYGLYETWRNNFVFPMLGLPAPKEVEKETIIGAGGHKYYKRKKEQSDTENGIIGNAFVDKEDVEQNKKDNIELKEKLFIWGRILGTVYAIRKVLQGLANVWKFGAKISTGVNNNINEQLGYFSIDPNGALNANVDKTRSSWYEGIRNLGDNSPVSKAGLDVMSQKFTDMWTAAMSGRSVDTRTTIDAQRIKDFFGVDYTVDGLLTGKREGKTATDIQRDAIIKVENQLSKLAEVDEIQRGQLVDSLRNLFGDELINAMVTNLNKRLRSDTYNKTVIEQIESYGNTTFASKDLTDKTISAVNSISNLKSSLSDLRNTIIQETSPAFVAVTDKMAEFVDWFNKKLTSAKGEKDETGAFSSMSAPEASKSARKLYGQSKDERTEKGSVSDLTETLKNAKSIYDVADVIYKTNPLTRNVADAESIKQKRYLNELGKAIASGNVKAGSKNEVISSLADYEYGGKKGLEALRLAIRNGEIDLGSYANNPLLQKLFFSPYSLSNRERIAAQNLLPNIPFFANLFYETFKEGGPEDLSADMNFGKYLLNESDFDNPEDWFEVLKSLFDSIKNNKYGRDYIKSVEYNSEKKADTNKDNVLDFKEVRANFKMTLTDQFGREVGFSETRTVGEVQ